jgi:hypothetical protein
MTSRLPVHPALRPFRLRRATVIAHRQHGPTPFLGCAVCIREGVVGATRVRWTTPRMA